MANLDALLRIKAAVTGAQSITALGDKIKQVEKHASGLTKVSGLLAPALGSLAPIATISGIGALAQKTISAGDAMYDLSQRTGVSVESLAKFKKAAATSGTDLDAVAGALVKLSRNMAAAASSSRFGERTKDEVDKAVDSVRDGERRQTALIRDQADQRLSILERETDKRLGEIAKRYRREEQLLNDRWDDQSDAAERAAQEQTDREIKQIERSFEARKDYINSLQGISEEDKKIRLQQLEDEEDAAIDVIRDGASREAKLRQRAARDAQQQVTDELNTRREREESIIRSQIENQKKLIKGSADYQIEQIKRASEESAKALKADTGADEASQQMEELGLSGKAASKAFAELGIAIKNQDGTLRASDQVFLDIATKFKTMPDGVEKTALALKLFGKSGAEMIPLLNMGGDAIDKLKVKMTSAFAEKADQYTDKLTILTGKIGGLGAEIAIALLPAMEALVDVVTTVVDAFMKMPEPLRSVVGVVTLLTIAITTLTPLISGLTFALGALGSLSIGATIAGWIAALGPLLQGIAAFAAGFVSWPVVIAAALIAVGVLIYKFRDEIGGVFQGIWEGITKGFNVVKDALVSFLTSFPKNLETFADAISASITKVWDWLGDRFNDLTTLATNLVRGISDIFKGIGDALAAPFRAAADTAKNILRSLLTFAANIINTFIAKVNQLIRGVNNVSSKIGLTVPEISYVSVPQFATGAFVKGRTLAEIGEGGQPEYVIPANRMASASQAYLQGARGIDVVNGRQPAGAAAGGGRTAVYIQNTGPIMQTPDGSQWARVEDLAAVVEAVAIMASGRR